MKNVTDFRKTVETSVDPHLGYVISNKRSNYFSSQIHMLSFPIN